MRINSEPRTKPTEAEVRLGLEEAQRLHQMLGTALEALLTVSNAPQELNRGIVLQSTYPHRLCIVIDVAHYDLNSKD
jgi:hypothetical protein